MGFDHVCPGVVDPACNIDENCAINITLLDGPLHSKLRHRTLFLFGNRSDLLPIPVSESLCSEHR